MSSEEHLFNFLKASTNHSSQFCPGLRAWPHREVYCRWMKFIHWATISCWIHGFRRCQSWTNTGYCHWTYVMHVARGGHLASANTIQSGVGHKKVTIYPKRKKKLHSDGKITWVLHLHTIICTYEIFVHRKRITSSTIHKIERNTHGRKAST
jgi:hypothetical protein